MAPRRGGEGGAGAHAALGGGRGTFEPPPLKRMYPWLQDGSGQCDVIAGGVDESGIFKGVYVSGVHLMALLRTFQLSKVFMPVDVPIPVAALGQSLQDGIPLVVVTRGCFGRDMDYGLGPLRNEMQKSVWAVARQMRAEMPQVLITCIDLPINCGTDVVQACLEAPLNEYHELMYHDGTWYTPSVTNAASVAKWKAEHKREKQQAKTTSGINFNRKKFAWVDETQFYKDAWTVGWKPVLEVRPPPAVPRRTDLNFLERERPEVRPIQDAAPSAAEATFRKAAARAREAGSPGALLASVRAYLERAKFSERQGLEEAVGACLEAGGLFRGGGDAAGAFEAMATAVGAYIYSNEIDKALQLATELKSSAASPKIEVKATRLILDCHFALGELEKAVEAAKSVKADMERKEDAEALCASWQLVVTSNIYKGDVDAALGAAKEAAQAEDKMTRARGEALVAEAQMAKADQSEDSAAKSACWAEAVKAQLAARALFKELGLKKQEGAALEAAAGSLLATGDTAQAFDLARDLQAFVKDADSFPAEHSLSEGDKGEATAREEVLRLGATGCQFAAAAHLQEHGRSGKYLEGGQGAMLSSAMQAVALFEQLGDASRRTAAQKVLLQARRAAQVAL